MDVTFSVLMSVYYRESGKNLDGALESIWTKQTLKPNQIVLVQDGPLTEELYYVIEKYKKICGDVLCTVALEKNSGLVAALNKGLEYVTSDIVARMDSDDYSAFDRFEKQITFMQHHPLIDVLGGSAQEFSENEECVNIRRYPHVGIKEYIAKASPVCHATVMMNMRIFREGGLKYDSRYHLNEDIALWFDVLRKGYTISNIDDIIYFVRSDGGMILRRSRVKSKTEFYAYMRGIRDLYGLLTWRYVYPLSRFIFRMMPPKFIGMIYASKLRTIFLKSDDKTNVEL